MSGREYDDSGSNPLYPVVYYSIPGTEDFQIVAHFDDGGGYDWTDWVVWYSPSRRRYFILSGSGCSCDSLSQEAESINSFTAVASKEAAKADLRAFIDNHYNYRELRDRPAIDAEIAAINSFKAVAS